MSEEVTWQKVLLALQESIPGPRVLPGKPGKPSACTDLGFVRADRVESRLLKLSGLFILSLHHALLTSQVGMPRLVPSQAVPLARWSLAKR